MASFISGLRLSCGGMVWLLAWCLSVAIGTMAPTPVFAQAIASPEEGWPQFRGPCRDGVSTETGLLSSWPVGGPPLLWSATNLGSGYSSPIINGNRLFITGDVGEELHIFALDLEGRLLWKATNGASWKNPFPGARASCAFSSGRVFHMNAHGRVACFDAQSGRALWNVEVLERFDSRKPMWGISECLLIDRDKVIVTPAGRKAAMAALNKENGQTVWMSEALPGADSDKTEGPAYAPPTLIQLGGRRHIVGVAARHAFGVDADTGKLQWTFDLPTKYEVIGSSPVFWNDHVFVTAPDAPGGGTLLRLIPGENGVEIKTIWKASLDTCHGGMIAVGGFLYGAWYRAFNGWGCVDLKDGAVRCRSKELPMGSAVFADERLYCLSQNGIMALVKPGPEKWDIVSKFQFANERRNDVWAHPVVLNGRLYLRHQQTLRCYDVRSPL